MNKSGSIGGRSASADDKIRILFVIDGLGLGGAEMVVRDLVRNLDTRRFEVSVCCTKGLGNEIDEELVSDGFDVVGLADEVDHKVDYLTALKLRQIIRAKRAQIVHTHAAPALLDAAPCRLLMPMLKLVHTFHYGNYPFDSWRHHALEYICARRADKLIAVGFEQRQRIQETYRLSNSRIEVVWNGIAASPLPLDTSFRADIGTGDRLLVGTIAKLIEQKGLDDLLRVAQRCRDAGLPMQFVVVGEGPLRPELERHRQELGLEDTVVITGWIKNAAARVLPEFDVFLQTSRWEAMSIVILEAMAAEKAIVATRVGDNGRVLKHDSTGILVDVGDIEGIADALIRTADAELRKELGQAAKIRFERKFTVEQMVQQYERIYSHLTKF